MKIKNFFNYKNFSIMLFFMHTLKLYTAELV